METETETVVFEVDVSAYEKSLAELTKSINTLKTSQKELQQQTKDGAEGAAEALEKTNAQLKVQQQQYRTTQNVLVGYIGSQQKGVDVMKFANNSIQTNRDLLKQLTAQYINLKNPSEEMTKRIKTLSDTLKQQEGVIGDTRRNVGNYFNEFAKGIPVLGQVIDPVRNIVSGFKDAGGGAAGFSAAILGGIPLIIAGIEGIVSVMKKFDSVTEGLADSFSGVNVAFDYFIAHANEGSLSDMIDNIGKAYDEGVKLSEAMRKIVEGQQLLNVANAAAQKDVEALIIQSKDRTQSEEKRIELLDKASQIEKANLEENLKFARARREIAGDELIRVMSAGLNDDKQRKENADAATALINLERESANLQEKILNRRNALEEEIKQERDKRIAEEIALEKKRLDALNATANENARLEKVRIEALQVGLQKEESLYELAFETKIVDLRKAGLTEIEIEEVKQRELNEIRKRYAQKDIEIEYGKSLEKARIQEEANQKMADDALKAKQQEEQSIISFVSNVSGAVSSILGAVSNMINQTASDNIASLEEQVKQGSITQKQFDAETRELKLKAWKQSKAIAITQAVMNTANAVMAQLSNPTPYVGIVLAALAAVMGGIQIATIAKQKPPTFAKGGVIPIGGRSHSEGGTPVHVGGQHVAEVEKGEGMFIMKKDAYRDIDMLSGWNQRYGGKSWTNATRFAADGGMITMPTSDGGYSTREVKNTVDNAMIMESAIMNGFSKAPAPQLSIVELNNKQKSRNRSVTMSEL